MEDMGAPDRGTACQKKQPSPVKCCVVRLCSTVGNRHTCIYIKLITRFDSLMRPALQIDKATRGAWNAVGMIIIFRLQ